MSGIPHPTGEVEKDQQHWGKYTRPGDVHNSKCHDCFCAIIFILISIAMLTLLIYGLVVGRPWALLNSWDDTGNYCGKNNSELAKSVKGYKEDGEFKLRDFTDYPYLFFAAGRVKPDNTIDEPGDIQICVKECPGRDAAYTTAMTDTCLPEERICPAWFTAEQSEAERKIGGACVCPYPTTMLINRCIPELDANVVGALSGNATVLFDAFKNIIYAIPGFGQSVMACVDYWMPILVFSVASILVSFFWVGVLRCMAAAIVYLVVIAVPIVLAALGCWFFFFGENSFGFANDTYNKYLAYALWGLTGIVLLIVIFIWGSLKKAVQVIKIAARALSGNCTALMAPIVSGIVAIVIWGTIIVSCVFNYSAANFEVEIREDDKPFMAWDINRTLQMLLIFNLVYVIFMSVFIYFQNYYAQSASIVEWYFSDHSEGCLNCRCLYGFGLAWTKALGTITASALIMTPLYLFMIIMEYLDRKAKQDQSTLGKFWQFIIKCMKCCLYCFEKLMKYLNKVLLTISQIYNKGWAKSAGLTMSVLMKDVFMTVLMNGVGSFILFLSKIVCAGLCSFGFFLYLKFYIGDTNAWMLAASCVFLLSFIASGVVINMYDNIIDIVFVCYQADNDLTNAGTVRPLYITDDMKTLMQDLKQTAANSQVEAASDDAAAEVTIATQETCVQ